MMRLILLLAITFSCIVLRVQVADSTSNLKEELEMSTTEEQATEDEGTTHTLVEPDALEGMNAYKSKKFTVRKFDQKKWKAIVGTLDYNEKQKEKPKPEEQEKVKPASKPWNGEILRVISFVLIIGVVISLLFFVLKNTSFNYKLKKKILHANDFVAPIENIEDLDIKTLLQQTLDDGNFRLAIRLYYLGLLKKLNEVGFIDWKKNKTNRDYLSELFSQDYYFVEVKKLTLAYELVWYGEHTLTTESFQKLITNFEAINQTLNTSKPL